MAMQLFFAPVLLAQKHCQKMQVKLQPSSIKNEHFQDTRSRYKKFSLLNSQITFQTLKKEESCLDRMFDRTVYGKEIEELAVKLADEFISKLNQSNDVEKSVAAVSEEVRQYSTDNRGR